MSSSDPRPPTEEKCANCGAPATGRDSSGRPICCAHCVFNPLGCRCKWGEPVVAETAQTVETAEDQGTFFRCPPEQAKGTCEPFDDPRSHDFRAGSNSMKAAAGRRFALAAASAPFPTP